jgi:3-deoxy-D-manno-octulosonic-acid transferase
MSGWMALYNLLGVPLLYVGFHVLGLFHRKVRRGIIGRKGLFSRIESFASTLGDEPRLWIHVSSLGEFEQAKPIAALAKERWPEVKVIVTFFSPSGYEHAGEVKYIDFISYLPFDSPRNARRFISLIRPSAGIVIRHDIWPNHVVALRRRGIPALLVDASVNPSHNKRGAWQRIVDRILLQPFTTICAVSEEQAQILRKLVPNVPVQVSGDTRYDQVVRRARELERIRDLSTHPSFKNVDLIVLGSTWPSDEDVVFPAVVHCVDRLGARAIVCPHEPSEGHLLEIFDYFERHNLRCLALSRWRESPVDPWDILVVDSVGLLANLYALGQVAYVGGSFGPGVHSVLEPAAHAKPVVIGPRYHNSPDARLLVKRGAATVVHNAQEAQEAFFRLVTEPQLREKMARAALEVVQSHTGASEKILDVLARFIAE